MERFDFAGREDLHAMQRLCSRLWTPTSRFHPGQLAWNRYYRPVDPEALDESEAISLWRSPSGEVVAFAWAEASDWLEVQLDPAHPELADEIVEWFEEWSDADEQSVLTMAGDPLESALVSAGFEPDANGWFIEHHVLDLAALPPVDEVAGYHFEHLDAGQLVERADCHARAWSEFGTSPVSAVSYANLVDAKPYRYDLDWVARDAHGQMAASVIVWFDEATGVGLVEPVGTVPEHRGKGMARGVVLAALHHLRELGATLAQVTPRGDDDYPGPRALYRGMGFRPTARTVTWTRSAESPR